MADYPIEKEPVFSETMRQLEVTDPSHADIFNPLFQTLLNNDGYLEKAKADKPKILSLTIPTEGWTAAAIGQYSYSLTLAVEGITAQDIIDGSITLETEENAQNCNMAIQCWSSDGAITFYAESIPTAEMVFEYYILKGAE